MGTINQRAAFAEAAEKENKRGRKSPKSKKASQKKMTPVSRKGKNKFRY